MKCMRHIGCSSKAASGNMPKFSELRASQSSNSEKSSHLEKSSRSEKSSWLEKSSRYNRKRASGARHTQCVRHTGCSSEAASGNVVEFHIGEFHKVTSSIEIVSHTFEGGWGGGSRNPSLGNCPQDPKTHNVISKWKKANLKGFYISRKICLIEWYERLRLLLLVSDFWNN